MQKDSRIYVSGHNGLVGSALFRRLKKEGYSNLIVRSRSELDLRDQAAVSSFFQAHHPEYVFLAAAKVGGNWPTVLIRRSSSTTTWPCRPT